MTGIVISLLAGGFLFGGPSIQAGIILGLMIVAGLSVLYLPLATGLKKTITTLRWPIDFAVSAGVFIMLGAHTATALVGGATTGLLVTLLLSWQKDVLKEVTSKKADVMDLIKASRKKS